MANSECFYWAINLKNSSKLIGTICIWNIEPEKNKAEIGYVLHPGEQGKGFMQEAVAAVIQYGFQQIKLQCLDAELHPDNKRSILLLERNGFTFAAESEDSVVYRRYNDMNKGSSHKS